MTPEPSAVALSPGGALYLLPPSPSSTVSERVRAAFATSGSDGLMHLGLSELDSDLTPDLAYWRDFARLYFSRLCALPGLAEFTSLDGITLPPPRDELGQRAVTAPPMVGGEYLNAQVLSDCWDALHLSVRGAVGNTARSVHDFFATHGSAWNLVGRV